MRFDPTTDDAPTTSSAPLPAGEYDCEVVEAEEAVSKAGNEMVKVRLKVWDQNGGTRTVFDYLVSNLSWKIRGFCAAFNLMDRYEAGTLTPEDMIRLSGRVRLRIKHDAGYEPTNAVAEYVAPKSAAPTLRPQPARQSAPARDLDDAIPF